MKTLIVYYSLEGNTEMIANKMKEHLKADIVRLVPKKDVPTGSFKKYFWGGKSAMFGDKPELEEYQADMEAYDVIIIGTPVWAGTFAPAVGTFLAENQIKEKEIYLFACHGSGGAEKCFKKLEEKLVGNIIKENIDFEEPKKGSNVEISKKVEEFCKKIEVN